METAQQKEANQQILEVFSKVRSNETQIFTPPSYFQPAASQITAALPEQLKVLLIYTMGHIWLSNLYLSDEFVK